MLEHAARHDWIEETALAKLSPMMVDFKKRVDDDKECRKAMLAAHAP